MESIRDRLRSGSLNVIRLIRSAFKIFGGQKRPKDENSPISSNEFLLRAIPNNTSYYSTMDGFTRGAFTPSTSDADGLSMYREEVIRDAALLAGSLPLKGDYYVVRIAFTELSKQGLTVVPTKGHLPGHTIIPELAIDSYKRNKARMKEVQLKLITIANENIVYRPPIKNAIG